MLDVDEHFARPGNVRVRDQAVDGVDRRRRHTGSEQLFDDLLDRMRTRPLFNQRLDLGMALHPLGVGVEARIFGEGRLLDRATDQAPQLIVRRGNDDTAVACRERVVGVARLVPIADAFGHSAIGQIDLGDDLQARDHRVDQGDVDLLPHTGLVAMAQRRKNADGDGKAGEDVGHGSAGSGRLASRPTGGAHKAAHGLGDDVVARAQAIGAGVAETGDSRVHQSRVDCLQRFVADAEFVHRSGPVVLDNDVGALDEFEEHLAPLAFEVQRYPLLAPVQVHVVGAFVVLERREVARVVTLAGLLDLDDLGAHVGQHHGAEGAGKNPGQVEDAQAAEGAVGVVHLNAPW